MSQKNKKYTLLLRESIFSQILSDLIIFRDGLYIINIAIISIAVWLVALSVILSRDECGVGMLSHNFNIYLQILSLLLNMSSFEDVDERIRFLARLYCIVLVLLGLDTL